MKPKKNNRILLKLSGEALGDSEEGSGLNLDRARQVAQEIAESVQKGFQIAVVVGAGNLWRGGRQAGLELERTVSDTMGMLGTVMNSLALGEMIREQAAPSLVLSAIGPEPLVQRYSIAAGRKALDEGKVLVCAGGTNNPYFTTDSAAALRALELGADILLKATNVDGVYSADPNKDPSATLYSKLSFAEVIGKRLRVMDTAAFSLCAEGNIPIFVFNSLRPGGIVQAVLGQGPGTRVGESK